MPAATEYLPDDQAQRREADKELDERGKLYASNLAYYRGHHKRYLKPRGGHDDNVVINLVRQTIDRTVAFLVPEFPTLELDEEEDTDEEQWLMDTWQNAGGAALLSGLVLNGALTGHNHVKITLPEAGQDSRIIPLRPGTVCTFWDADDKDKVLWHELRWKVGKVFYRQDVVNEGNRWMLYDYQRTGSKWEKGDETVWPYEFGPIVESQHLPVPNEFYGDHELQHRGLNDMINAVASDMKRILRYHASPRTIMTGVTGGAEGVQPTAVDGVWSVESADARAFNLEMQSDLGASMAFLQLLTDAFLSESRVTMIHGGPEVFRGMTNLGIRAAFMDTVAKNETLRRSYGELIQRVSQVLLVITSRPAEPVPLVLWGEALPVDKREEVQLVAQQMEMDLMSHRTASSQLGLDFDKEQKRRRDEALADGLVYGGQPDGATDFTDAREGQDQQRGQLPANAGTGN